VRFQDRQDKTVVERLQILDTVPDSIAVGDHVAVVFDPDAPDSVLLASAMDTNHVTQDYVVGGLGIAATFLGIGWWWLTRSQRTASG
jgi:hypothetical protein